MGTVLPKEKSLSYRALTFTVTRLREKFSPLSSQSGNIIPWAGLFLNYACDKYTVLDVDVWSLRCLSGISCQTGTGSRLCVSSAV